MQIVARPFICTATTQEGCYRLRGRGGSGSSSQPRILPARGDRRQGLVAFHFQVHASSFICSITLSIMFSSSLSRTGDGRSMTY